MKEVEGTRDARYNETYARASRSQAVKSLTPAERLEVQTRLTQDQEFERELQDQYADRLIKTGKAKSKAEAVRMALETDTDTLLSEYRPNKLSAKFNKVKDRLPASDELWWTPQERATVKAEIEDFFKEAGVPDTVDINNLRASVEGINSLRRNMPPELQEKANAIVSAISTGTPVGVMKQAGKRAVEAATKMNSLKPAEDFAGKSQAPSKGRQMRKANAETKRSTS